MYGRSYGERELRFEASGGLNHSSVILRDKETDSWWSLMEGVALAGELQGTRLEVLPVGTKMQWGEWKRLHPGTRVLTKRGRQEPRIRMYQRYMTSEKGFRGAQAEDDRLPSKAPIFAFFHQGRAFAVAHAEFEGGAVFDLGDRKLFLYRPEGSHLIRSSVAFLGSAFRRDPEGWVEEAGHRFEPRRGRFLGSALAPVTGFDTYWLNWSLSHPETELVR